MFTVIFAEKETIELFEETKMFFGPLLDSEKVAFCEWDKDACTFDTMVPDLYELVQFKTEWRAIILNDDNVDKLNPFDYTMYSEPFYNAASKDWDYYKNRRLNRFDSYQKAISNPLLKLTTALCGMPKFNSVISDAEAFEGIVSGKTEMFEFMLKSQLFAINCSEAAARFGRFQRESLNKFVKKEDIDTLLSCLKNNDASGIVKLIPDAEIPEFIKLIGNDPEFYDPEYTECLIENTKKAELLSKIAEEFSMKDKLPSEIICFSPRIFDFKNSEQDVKWKKRDENSYSRFSDFNLYNNKLKFVLFDILPTDNKQYKFELIKLLCLLLVFANNDLPKGVISANHVYRANIDFDTNIVTAVCEKYISKLKATEIHLKDVEFQIERENDDSIDDRTAQRLFESNVNIPIKTSLDHRKTELFAEYKRLGLSTDCPEDESSYWSKQYRSIYKRFIRFLREPRRAVKSAVVCDFRENNEICDDRSLLLSENQIEDVQLHLLEEEQKMVDTTTTHLYDTKRFTEQLQDADKEIRRAISQRMTRKKTVCVGLMAALAYLFGFLPLIFSNFNTVKSFLFSLSVTGITLAAFMAVGFLYLFVLRKKLVNRFKHFNYVVCGICNRISSALAQFSKYISSACNVMRDFSVLKKRDSNVTMIKRILSFHDMKIKEQIENVHDMFSKYVDFSKIGITESEPYDFDFTVMCDYEYDMPSIQSKKKIVFLQQGNEIIVPIDYIESITLTREELYD